MLKPGLAVCAEQRVCLYGSWSQPVLSVPCGPQARVVSAAHGAASEQEKQVSPEPRCASGREGDPGEAFRASSGRHDPVEASH